MKEAKKYFIEMDCSHFYMAREYPERYSEYQKMSIDKQIEQMWREEFLEKKIATIEQVTDNNIINSLLGEIRTAVFSEFEINNVVYYIKAVHSREAHLDGFNMVVISESIVEIFRNKKSLGNYATTLLEIGIRLSKRAFENPEFFSRERIENGKIWASAYEIDNIKNRAKTVYEKLIKIKL